MAVSQIIKDMRCLKKLIKDATGLKVYESEAISHHDLYWSISDEYKDKNNPHITVTHGSHWSIDEGAEYKISIYAPSLSIGIRRKLNTPLFQSYIDRIVQAFDNRFGEKSWNCCNEEYISWRPMSRFSFYVQIPNFKD